MNDRELLELAAKAAGIYLHGWREEPPSFMTRGHGLKWNPLTDDGDALRLAVKLNLTVMNETDSEAGGSAGVSGRKTECHETTVGVLHEGDPYAATRRAIVMAAAEIGRTK